MRIVWLTVVAVIVAGVTACAPTGETVRTPRPYTPRPPARARPPRWAVPARPPRQATPRPSASPGE